MCQYSNFLYIVNFFPIILVTSSPSYLNERLFQLTLSTKLNKDETVFGTTKVYCNDAIYGRLRSYVIDQVLLIPCRFYHEGF